jgi:poly(3-hydroxybutyrate) depolymerase
MITVMGQQVRLWVGPKKGPMVFYWHGTGSRAEEAISGLGPGLNEVMSQGGVIASFTTTTMMGRTTGNNVWYYGDFDMADQILACANQQGLIDPQRIYSAGCSAGGIQTSTMGYSRSGYLAAGTQNSGGIIFMTPLQDTSHVPFQMSSHGARDKDVVHAGQANAMIDVYFADITANNNKDLVAKGGFAINCDHGGQHCANPPELTAAMWQFLKDHTFDTQVSPYAAGLPASFPPYCQIVH